MTNPKIELCERGEPTAPRDANRVAGDLLERAPVMQTEIDRFLAIAAGRSAA